METFDVWMRALRRRRRLSLSQIARLSGISKSTIVRWESGRSQPRITELRQALDALGASCEEQAFGLRLLDVPRAIVAVRATEEETELPLSLGDLLYGLRQRAGLTQQEAAREAGVSRSLYVKWEADLSRPSEARLHRACYALKASAEEVAWLTTRSTRDAPLARDRTALLEVLQNDLPWERDATEFELFHLGILAALGRLYRRDRADIADLALVLTRFGNGQEIFHGDDEAAYRYYRRARRLADRSQSPLNLQLLFAFRGSMGRRAETPPSRLRIDDWLSWRYRFPSKIGQAYFLSSVAQELARASPEEALKLGRNACALVEEHPDELACRRRDLGNLMRACGDPGASVEYLSHMATPDAYRKGLNHLEIALGLTEVDSPAEAHGQLMLGTAALHGIESGFASKIVARVERRLGGEK